MSSVNVQFKCPHCGVVSEGSSEYVGMESECPSCGKSFQLEAIDAASTIRLSPWTCYLRMFKRYANFKGRTPRREFWWAFLFDTIAIVVVYSANGFLIGSNENWLLVIYLLAAFIPRLTLYVRRLHDTNKSGWWWLLLFMPVVNIACIVWLATDSDKGDNRFGSNPKGR